MNTNIEQFLACSTFAVVGASTNRAKFGNKILRCYMQHDMNVVPINPREAEIEGVAAHASIGDVPGGIDAISFVTPPAVTETVVAEAIEQGVKHIWFQPGTESPAATQAAIDAGLNVIGNGACLLVEIGFDG